MLQRYEGRGGGGFDPALAHICCKLKDVAFSGKTNKLSNQKFNFFYKTIVLDL